MLIKNIRTFERALLLLATVMLIAVGPLLAGGPPPPPAFPAVMPPPPPTPAIGSIFTPPAKTFGTSAMPTAGWPGPPISAFPWIDIGYFGPPGPLLVPNFIPEVFGLSSGVPALKTDRLVIRRSLNFAWPTAANGVVGGQIWLVFGASPFGGLGAPDPGPIALRGPNVLVPTVVTSPFTYSNMSPRAFRFNVILTDAQGVVVAVLDPYLVLGETPPAEALPVFPLDHFQCYKARHANRGSGSRLRPRSFDLVDQFGKSTAVVLRPKLLCNPVDKDGEGVQHENAHLTCYKIKRSHKKHFVNRRVVIQNQIESTTLAVSGTRLLCIPSNKTEIGGQSE